MNTIILRSRTSHGKTVALLALTCLSLFGCQLYQPSADRHYKPPRLNQMTNTFIASEGFTLEEKSDLIGYFATIEARQNDTLPDIARHFGLGYNDITVANPDFDPWLLESGYRVILPMLFILPDTPREGLVLNLSSMRLFYYPEDEPGRVYTYPVGIGRDGWNTPTGLTKITQKKKNPQWTVPASIRREHANKGDPLPPVVPPGPDNPLGDFAMRLGFPSYLIHGTNKPYGVGMQISHGCVRLYPEDIASLFVKVPVGIRVNIVEQPYLLGWENTMLYLEAHQPEQKQLKKSRKELYRELTSLAEQNAIAVDWEKVEFILEQAAGIPLPILENSSDYASILFSATQMPHPEIFNQQPRIEPITSADWSVTVASFENADDAQKLAAMLTHQGPPIPSRRIYSTEMSHVVAGPFVSEEEAQSVINKIKKEFQLEGKVNPPQTLKQAVYPMPESWVVGSN